jgi:hypothetical protein
MKKALFGIAESEDQASSIVNQLKGARFSDNDISVLFPGTTGTRHFAHEQHSKAPEGAAIGAGSGVVLGGAFGWLVAIDTLAMPGLGALIAVGPIMAALAGAGAAVGGVTGAAVGMGMPEYEAKQYKGRMKGGNILISVHTQDRPARERAKEIFKNAGAVTAAEAIVDRAYGKPSAAERVAMNPSPEIHQVRDLRVPDPLSPTA